jgi:hypothetical protein
MRAKSESLNDDSSVWNLEARDTIANVQTPSVSTTMDATVVSQQLLPQVLCNPLPRIVLTHAAPHAILAINIIL